MNARFLSRITFPDGKLAFTGLGSPNAQTAKKRGWRVDGVVVEPRGCSAGFVQEDLEYCTYTVDGDPIDPNLVLSREEVIARFN